MIVDRKVRGNMREHLPSIRGRKGDPIPLGVTLTPRPAVEHVRRRIGVNLVADEEQHVHAGQAVRRPLDVWTHSSEYGVGGLALEGRAGIAT